MTLKRFFIASFIFVLPLPHAHANEPSPSEEDSAASEVSDYRQKQDESLREKRSTLDALPQASIAPTTTPLRLAVNPPFVGINGSQLLELNNESWRRCTYEASNPEFSEFQFNYVYVRDSRSSQQLALTPYRQPGRPARFELDMGLTGDG